jgi:S-formylglutathione hydrolase FrmB
VYFQQLHAGVRFRAVAGREGRTIDGFSMGGYGAARLGFKCPDRFIPVSLMGAGPLRPDFNDAPRAGPKGRDRVFQQVFGGDMEYYRSVSP